jgi:hypothetical protein
VDQESGNGNSGGSGEFVVKLINSNGFLPSSKTQILPNLSHVFHKSNLGPPTKSSHSFVMGQETLCTADCHLVCKECFDSHPKTEHYHA